MGKKMVDVLGLEIQVLKCSIKVEPKISKYCSVLLFGGHSNKELCIAIAAQDGK